MGPQDRRPAAILIIIRFSEAKGKYSQVLGQNLILNRVVRKEELFAVPETTVRHSN